ncbi:MAG TPA: hypothetical protein VG457_12780 [Planctomycetota bacterium]|nr:hypothetical protein [Planctomycetota bacterium]
MRPFSESWAMILLVLGLLSGDSVQAQQVSGGDLDKILERADKLLEEAKAAYDTTRATSSSSVFVEAGFKLEEVRIKWMKFSIFDLTGGSGGFKLTRT